MITLLSVIFLLISLSISIFPGVNSREEDSLSAYDVLKIHGLPIGLLPKGVKDFRIDDTGRFEIGALSGISAQELFLWFPVKGIRVDIPSTGLIYFDVGVVSKQFSLSLFEKPRDCMAVRDGQREDIRTGKLIAEAVFKSQLGELRYHLDQQNFGRSVM
ncbi:hypothetical protein M5689_018398 [Euphorbia peplus]|nr:hypothetical protein M5689_018398 [Euphorbia peplus]